MLLLTIVAMSLQCTLRTEDPADPPMFLTLTTSQVKVDMGGLTYTTRTYEDGELTYWQVTGTDRVNIRSRLNRATKVLTIRSEGHQVEGDCETR